MTEFHQIKASKNGKVVHEVEEGVYVYTFFGRHDYEDDNGYPMLDAEDRELEDIIKDPEVYAIKTVDNGIERYYVKRGRYGHLFNPIGLYSEGTQAKQERHAGKPLWTLKRTHNKKVFDFYVNFLKSKNPAWLQNAEREV